MVWLRRSNKGFRWSIYTDKYIPCTVDFINLSTTSQVLGTRGVDFLFVPGWGAQRKNKQTKVLRPHFIHIENKDKLTRDTCFALHASLSLHFLCSNKEVSGSPYILNFASPDGRGLSHYLFQTYLYCSWYIHLTLTLYCSWFIYFILFLVHVQACNSYFILCLVHTT